MPQITSNDDAPLLTLRQAASLLNVSKRTLERWAATGHLHTIRLGKVHRIQREELERVKREGVPLDTQGEN